MPVSKEIVESYKNYGRCVKVTNGIIEAYVTVDVGPRIIRFAFVGGENILYNDLDRSSGKASPEHDEYYYKGAKWYSYGGHRLWVTPESSPETYYPDNDPVEYQYTDNGAVFNPPAQISNRIQMQIEIAMSENSADMNVIHRVTNLLDKNLQLALWGITVLGQGGLEIIPQNTHDTGFLPNRILSLWPYANATDERFYMGKEYITVRQSTKVTDAFKIGTDNHQGFAAYSRKNDVFVCRYEPNHGNGTYPDNGVSFETYTNSTILEMETLSEINDLAPGQSAEHSINWTLYENPGEPNCKDEAAIKEFINKLV